ncbi:MAG: hypothetical protein Q9191_008184, partial [Dirinaria sp. TL-2023a]
MRPALHEFLKRPSRLAFLRHANGSPFYAPTYYGRWTLPQFSRRKQSSTSDSSKEKGRPLVVGGASASILSYVTGQFKKRRKGYFKYRQGQDSSKGAIRDVVVGEKSSADPKVVEREVKEKLSDDCQDVVTAGSLFNVSAEEINRKRGTSPAVQLELKFQTRDPGNGCHGEGSTISGPRIQKYVDRHRAKPAPKGLFRKIESVLHRPHLNSADNTSHQALPLARQKLAIKDDEFNVVDDVDRDEILLEEGGTAAVQERVDLTHSNDIKGFSMRSYWYNFLVWDWKIPYVSPFGAEHDQRNVSDDVSISSTNALTPFAKVESTIDWTAFLTSFEQLAYESDVESEPTKGPRLVDFPEYASDFELWLRLVQFRQRHRLAIGLLPIWKRVVRLGLHLPTEGEVADLLWTSFLDLGFSNYETLDEIIHYAIMLKDRTGRGWEMLYYRIMRRCLENPDADVYHRHLLLHRHFPPTRQHYLSLYQYAISQVPQLQRVLQQMYKDLSFRDLYSPIMHFHFETLNYRAAASWHKLLIAERDLPEDVQDYRPLFRYMILYGDPARLTAMVHQMVEAKVPLPNFIKDPTRTKPITREMISQRLADTHGVVPKILDDQFYARLFATKLFPVEAVIQLLRMLGANMVGPASMRELVLRVGYDPEAIQARLEQMKEIGVSFGESVFCRLVIKLVETGNTRLLGNVATCDLHPDTFEDVDLQEALLSNYEASGDQLQFNRTLAILMTHCPEKYQNAYSWNIYLRLYLRRKDIPAISRTLDMMQASHVKVDRKSTAYVRISLMSRRRRSVRPNTFDELPLIINIWQSILRSGGTIPATVWVEILKRLGMVGKLE